VGKSQVMLVVVGSTSAAAAAAGGQEQVAKRRGMRCPLPVTALFLCVEEGLDVVGSLMVGCWWDGHGGHGGRFWGVLGFPRLGHVMACQRSPTSKARRAHGRLK
jgi:hypothetical protein